MNDVQRKRIAEAAVSRKLAPDGPMLERFDALAMAVAIEQEAERATLYGRIEGTTGKVEIHMDPRDAFELAAFLRRHGGH